MRHISLLAGLLCITLSIFAQKDWEMLIQERPSTALEEAKKMYLEAKKSNDTPRKIYALILQDKAILTIDASTYPQVIKEREKSITDSKNSVEKAVLHSIVADLYRTYYSNNQWQLYKNKPIEAEVPEDIELWSSDMFHKTIFTHALAALDDSQKLKETDAEAYRVIFPKKEDEITDMTPTLFDVLARNSIELLTQNATRHYIEIEKLYRPLDELLELELHRDNNNYFETILWVYQQLLSFCRERNNDTLLLLTDLERLKFEHSTYRTLETDTTYIAALDVLIERHNTSPYVVEVLYEKALYYHRSSNDSNKHHLLALKIAQEAVTRFPDYPRTDLCRQLIKNIESPTLSTSFSNDLYPGDFLELKVHYYNVADFKVEINKINEQSGDYYKKKTDEAPINRQQVIRNTYSLPQSLEKRDTVFYIPIRESGLYEISYEIPEVKSSLQTFVCTALFTTQKHEHSKVIFCVRDSYSGKPVKKARILLFEDGKNQLKKGELVTDKNGYASYTPTGSNIKNGQSLYYEVVDSKNPNGHQSVSWLHPNNSESSRNFTELFTDRKIYRPGQALHFKGITYDVNYDRNSPGSRDTDTVYLLNTKSEIIGEKIVKINPWGSFSGTFTIPYETVNGFFYMATQSGAFTHLQVAEYKRPSFEITTEPIETAYHFGDTIRVKGQTQTFSGTSLNNTNISYQISQQSYLRWSRTSNVIEKGEATTDAKGDFFIEFIAAAPKEERSPFGFYYLVEITASDNKGESQTLSQLIPIGKESYRIDINMPTYINKQHSDAIFVKTFNPHATELDEEINYQISRLQPLRNLKDSYNTDSLNIEKIITEGILHSKQDSLSFNFSGWESGAYLFTAMGDSANIEKQIFYLYSPSDKQPPILTYNWFIQEKNVCRTGEKAEILLGSSAKNVYVSYELYDRGRMIKQERFKLSNRTKRLFIPYEKEYGNELKVVLSFVKDKQFFNNETLIIKKQESRELIIKTETFRDKLLPGQKEEWKFSIHTKEGTLKISEIMAGMYDRSLDKFASNYWYFSPQSYLRYDFPVWRRIFYGYPIRYYLNKSDDYVIAAGYQNMNTRSFSGSSDILARKMRPIASYDEVVVTEAEEDSTDSEGTTQPEFSPRQNFNETAFFYPQLYSDENGEFSFSFTVPEALTSWKLMLLAHTQDLKRGYLEKEIITTKDLTVMPNIPRFFRTGDSTIVKATISNLSKKALNGDAKMELFDPQTNEIILSRSTPFDTQAGENKTVAFDFVVPENTSLIGCRIVAGTEQFSDGEQHLIAVAPAEIMLTETLPIFSSEKGNSSFKLQPMVKQRKDYRLTLEMTANPIWYALMALPTLQEAAESNDAINLSSAFYGNAVGSAIAQANPSLANAIRNWSKEGSENESLRSPLEQNAELKSALLSLTPWVQDAQNETERITALQQLLDVNRLKYLQEKITTKLSETQNPEGGWSWYKGMESSRFITCNVLLSTIRASIAGESVVNNKVKRMQIKALQFLDKDLEKEYNIQKEKKAAKTVSYDQLAYLYTRSFFRDIPLTEVLEAHKYYMELLKKGWLNFSPYEKALAATTLYRYGFTDEAKRIVRSIREYATVSKDMGMYWANNRSSVYYINSAILTHSTILEALYEIDRNDKETDAMKLWLLRQKQTQNWGNVPSTVNAVYALLLTGSNQLEQMEQVQISLGNTPIETTSSLIPGYSKQSFSASEIKPDMLEVRMTKENETPSWGGLYLQYFAPLNAVKKNKNTAISINKTLYIEKNTDTGKELVPIKENLNTGDKLIVRLVIKTERDMQYVHLKDLRAACLEPVEQLSGTQWQQGMVYYQETKDVVTNFFFHYLPKGTHIIEYPMWVNQSGRYQDGVATIQCLYAPEYSAHSDTQNIEVE